MRAQNRPAGSARRAAYADAGPFGPFQCLGRSKTDSGWRGAWLIAEAAEDVEEVDVRETRACLSIPELG